MSKHNDWQYLKKKKTPAAKNEPHPELEPQKWAKSTGQVQNNNVPISTTRRDIEYRYTCC